MAIDHDNSPKFLSRGIDYLNNLASKLRDLRGFATLAHELIQNADDSRDASLIAFDIRDDALVVYNNGVFTDCGQMETADCPWKMDPATKHRCDFHRFRLVASGDKRDEADTTGAFGIGFIAVYQITDQPELISAGRHWILHENRPESERIEVCSGCENCQRDVLPGTRFILPWAKDPNSSIRTGLRAQSISSEDLPGFSEDLEDVLPTAMIFLRKLSVTEIRRNGELVRRLERVVEGDSLIVSDGEDNHIWHLLSEDFQPTARELKERFTGRIESSRSTNIWLAIPESTLDSGVFCAFLPTQQETGLPFHLNADLFTSSDRKRVLFESDYQAEWNRAAVSAAAQTLATNLLKVRDLLGHKRFWTMLESVYSVFQDCTKGLKERSLQAFWEYLLPKLREFPVIFTSTGEWRTSSDVLLLAEREEEESIPVLEMMGIALVHNELRPCYNLLRSTEIGVQLLDIPHVATALQKLGLTHRVELNALPDFLRKGNSLPSLWKEIGQLLQHRRRTEEQKAMQNELSKYAIAPGRDGALWPCRETYRADDATVNLFSAFDSGIPFLADTWKDQDTVASLCPNFSSSVAIEHVSRLKKEQIEEAVQTGRLKISELLKWFENRRGEVVNSEPLKKRLADLAIFPSSSGLQPLSKLAFPGDFKDPLEIAGLIDIDQVGGRREFLRDLGARELTFRHYVSHQIPHVLRVGGLQPEKMRALVALLAERLGEIRDDDAIRVSLVKLALIECHDGSFRLPGEVYFETQAVLAVLGDEACYAAVPSVHLDAISDLYRWLGVTESPRYQDVLAKIKKLTANAPTPDSVSLISRIVEHLGRRVERLGDLPDVLSDLCNSAWLPARGDSTRWYRPNEIFSVFRAYLFESRARFLDLPQVVQEKAGDLLKSLGVKSEPEVSQVVAHLLHCSEMGAPVNQEVYAFLNNNSKDPGVNRLRHKSCLFLRDNGYVQPGQVYWSAHPFGRFRYQLGPELRRFGELLSRLEVKEAPDHDDACAVILEISTEYGATNQPLDEAAYSVLMSSWQLLQRAVERSEIDQDKLLILRDRKIIPNSFRVLMLPERMLFEDRAGFATMFGEVLRDHVIPRLQGSWRAMEAVGMRSLFNTVTSQLLECVDPSEGTVLAKRLKGRHVQLARLFESHVAEGIASLNLDMLADLNCQAVRALKVGFSLKLFNQKFDSPPRSLPAHFHREDRILYFVGQGDSIPWPSVARELAVCLFPDTEPGSLALGIKEVLAADTDEAAQIILDELGFPPLQISQIPSSNGSEPVKELGGDLSQSGDQLETLPTEKLPSDQIQAEPPLTPEEAIRGILGPDTPPPNPMPPNVVITENSVNRNGTGGTGGRNRGKSKSQGKLRTYVVAEDIDTSRDIERDGQTERSDIDKIGVKRVLEYEIRQERFPGEMPPLHPGYDVESKDSSGGVVRYIEVKAVSGNWGSIGVGLSKTQFNRALELGEKYWLYVVENANSNDFKIYPIQDPARKVDQFLYDGGWQGLSEEG